MKLREVLPTFTLDHGRGTFRGWLRTMTRNLAIDWFRREGQRRNLEAKWRSLKAEQQAGDQAPETAWVAAHELSQAEWNDDLHRRVLTFVLEEGRAKWQPKTWACFEQWILADPPRPAADIARDLDIQAHAVRVNANRGKVAGGEGVLGLQRAFQAAGARALVVSLWKVHDAGTSVLMEEFYANLWKKPALSKLEALRQAQLTVLRHPERVQRRQKDLTETYAKLGLRAPEAEAAPLPGGGEIASRRSPPALWAAFVLSGDGR